MRISDLLASLVVALPSVLAAAVPAAENTAERAWNGTTGIAGRSPEAPPRNPLEHFPVGPLTEQVIDAFVQECAVHLGHDKCVKGEAAEWGHRMWPNMIWASVRSHHDANFIGEKGVNWFHNMYNVQETDIRWSTGHHDFYVFEAGTIMTWPDGDADKKWMVYAVPGTPNSERDEDRTTLIWSAQSSDDQ